jgi:hypothetical protein
MQLFIKCYLFVYNVAQWIIYSSIGLLCLTRLFLYGQGTHSIWHTRSHSISAFWCTHSDSVSGTYDAVDTLMSLGQGLAFLEIIHPLLGFVRTGLLAPILQVRTSSNSWSPHSKMESAVFRCRLCPTLSYEWFLVKIFLYKFSPFSVNSK